MPFMPSFASQRPRTYFGLLAAVGFLGAFLVPWLIVAAANMTPDKTFVALFDDRVANWLTENGTASTDVLFRVVSLFGDWALVAVMAAATYRFVRRRQLPKVAGLLIACVGAALLNVILAVTFRRAHPLSATNFESVAQGVSFPSGHSMVALVAYGMLTYFVLASARSSVVKQMASIAAAALLVGLIGLSRVYLVVHSVSDVVLGFAAGAVWLAACIVAYPRLVAAAATTSTPSVTTLQPITP
jgi:membrane-associated phospholipid phosphatase